jgi:hypothetical protein
MVKKIAVITILASCALVLVMLWWHSAAMATGIRGCTEVRPPWLNQTTQTQRNVTTTEREAVERFIGAVPAFRYWREDAAVWHAGELGARAQQTANCGDAARGDSLGGRTFPFALGDEPCSFPFTSEVQARLWAWQHPTSCKDKQVRAQRTRAVQAAFVYPLADVGQSHFCT